MPDDTFIHNTCVIDGWFKIGNGSKVWHFSHIRGEAEIGCDCSIGKYVEVGKKVKIGNGCKIQNHVSIYEGVVLGDFVFIGPSVVFTNVLNPRAAIKKMDQSKRTIVNAHVTIGANATIVCGITLGAYSFVGAGAVVTKDVEPYALVVGNPARQIGIVDKEGNRIS